MKKFSTELCATIYHDDQTGKLYPALSDAYVVKIVFYVQRFLIETDIFGKDDSLRKMLTFLSLYLKSYISHSNNFRCVVIM